MRNSYPALLQDRFSASAADHLVAARLNLPGYEVLDHISHGGQGVVLRAFHAETSREVAIKLLPPHAYRGLTSRQRIEREIRLLQRLQHPNIVCMYDSGVTTDEQPYLVMEFIQGLHIDEHTLVFNLDAVEILRLLQPLIHALHYAHGCGILHRDLKPSNALVNPSGEPVVVDFGMAKYFGNRETSLQTEEHHRPGTVAFMSPEQCDGHDLDARSDVYSLGMLLYVLLTRSFPYSVQGPLSHVQHEIWTASPTPMRTAHCPPHDDWRVTPAQFDRSLEGIVLTALAKNREDRYPSAAALGDDLQRYLDGKPVQAAAARRSHVIKTRLRRHRRAVVRTLAVVGVALVVAGVTLYYRGRTRQISNTAQTGMALASIQRMAGVERDGNRTEHARSLLNQITGTSDIQQTPDRLTILTIASAHTTLASMDLDDNQPDEALKALDSCRAYLDQHAPAGNIEWDRLRAHVYLRMGRAFKIKRMYPEAIRYYQLAIAHLEEIYPQLDDATLLEPELASSLMGMARAEWQLLNYDRAYNLVTRARDIYLDRLADEPESVDRLVDLTHTLLTLSGWHITQRNSEDGDAAVTLLDEAENHLRHVAVTGQQQATLERMFCVLEHNHAILAR